MQVRGLWLALLMLLFIPAAWCADINDARARYHYQMFCQGCHTPDGSGYGDVPALKGFVGTFLRSQAGREFLVRVPGSATSKLNDEQLAEVLNWTLENFAGASLPGGQYQPYTGAEVAGLRSQPLQEIQQHRAQVLTDIARQAQ